MDHHFEEHQRRSIHEAYFYRNAFCLWWIGMINNFHYTLVLSASTGIADGYGMKKYVALITWASVFFGIISRIVNAFILTILSYNVRVTATSVMAILALLLVSFAWDIGGQQDVPAFIVTLFGVVIIGIAGSYGEAVFLGYLERMPSKHIGAWSSGTGLSGVAASLILLGLTTAGLSISQVFLIGIPAAMLYWAFYFFGLYVPATVTISSSNAIDSVTIEGSSEQHATSQGPVESERDYVYKAMTNWSGTMWTNIIPAEPEEKPQCLKELERAKRLETMGEDGAEEPMESTNGEELSKWARWKRYTWPIIKEMHNFCLWNNINLAVVYIAEYAVQFMAPFSFPCDEVATSSSFWLKNSFVITQFCYQFGVLISRSSLLCVRIRQVWILSVIQILNAIAWFLQAKLKYMSDPNDSDRELKFAFGLFAWMIFVGLMGGASYVNVFYNILETTKNLEEREKSELLQFLVKANTIVLSTLTECNSLDGAVDGAAHLSCDLNRRESMSPAEAVADTLVVHSDGAHDGCCYIAAVWKEKRDLAMNIGALYATVGVTLGSLLDLFFTLFVLKDEEC